MWVLANQLTDSIAAFEACTRLTITVHDLDGSLLGLLDPEYSRHRHALCSLVKSSDQGHRCAHFEVTNLRPQLAQWPQGRIHRCHAGVVEWLVPVRRGATTCALLFAGARRWAGGDGLQVDEQLRPTNGLAKLAVVNRDEARLLLESLHQLSARLEQILRSRTMFEQATPQDRRSIIEHYVHHFAHNSACLSGLAQRLGVGADRCSHVARELTGRSWTELLNEYRLRMACRLLTTSDLSIAIIAQRAGFGDQSFFNRVFQRRFSISPGRWRREAHH